jgi:hypothetical protein
MSLWYEDISADPIGTFGKTRQFLGMPATNKRPSLRKLRTKERYERIITNYDEVVEEMGHVYGVPFGDPGNRWDDPEDRWNGIVTREGYEEFRCAQGEDD